MIAMAAGILLVAFLPHLPPLAPVAALTALLALLLAWRRHPLLVVAACLALGLSYGIVHGHSVQRALLPEALEMLPMRVTGRVSGLPETIEDSRGPVHRFDLKIARAECLAQKANVSCAPAIRRVRLSQYGGAAPAAGSEQDLVVKLKRPRGFANPGGFDYAAWLVRSGYDATGYVVTGTRDAGSAAGVDVLRARVAATLRERLERFPEGGVMLALAVGDGSQLTPQQWQQFNRTGTTHLMVISGLHIGIAAGFGAVVGALLARLTALAGLRLAGASIAGALVLASIYAALAGFSLPTQRALLMLVAGLFAVACQRQQNRWRWWSFALLAVLTLDPLAGYGAGFWLSFGAVALLLFSSSQYSDSRLRRALGAQWAIFLGLAPLLAASVGQVSLLSLPANLVLVPLYSLVVVPLVLSALGLEAVLPGLASLLWHGADALLGWCGQLLAWMSAWDGAVVRFGSAGPLSVALALAGMLVLLLPAALPGRWLGLLALLPLLARSPAPLDEGEWQLTVLDVGQGLSAVVRTRDHVLVFDVGARWSERFDTATTVVLPYLHSQGIARVDRLVLSHGDNDHAGAAEPFLAGIAVNETVVGEPVAAAPTGLRCRAGEGWLWNGVSFRWLHPGDRHYGNSNDRSCVLLISGSGRSALLSGDIESRVEAELVAAAVIAPVDILVAPHHGSATSSSPAFVSAVAPAHVIFSAGYKQSFGHPRPEVVARYLALGSRPWNTALDGAVSFRLSASGTQPLYAWRREARHFWDIPDRGSASGEASIDAVATYNGPSF